MTGSGIGPYQTNRRKENMAISLNPLSPLGERVGVTGAQ